MIERLPRETGPSSQRTQVDHHTTLLARFRVFIPQDPQGLFGHVDRPPEVGVQHRSRLAIFGAFRVTGKSIPGIVDDDIDAAKLVHCRAKGCINGGNRSDV